MSWLKKYESEEPDYSNVEMGNGGPIDTSKKDNKPKDWESFKNFNKTLPENLRDDSFTYGDYSKYDLYGMWEASGKPKTFQDVKDTEYFPLQEDNTYHGFSIGNEGIFLKPKSHPTAFMEYASGALNPDLKNLTVVQREDGRLQYVPKSQMAKGGLIKRADGSYSKRGLWDNIRANKGSGKKPTKEMLEQERKIKAQKKKEGGPIDPPVFGGTLKPVEIIGNKNRSNNLLEAFVNEKGREDYIKDIVEDLELGIIAEQLGVSEAYAIGKPIYNWTKGNKTKALIEAASIPFEFVPYVEKIASPDMLYNALGVTIPSAYKEDNTNYANFPKGAKEATQRAIQNERNKKPLYKAKMEYGGLIGGDPTKPYHPVTNPDGYGKPIYVTDKNDPRLRSYNDSLSLHKQYYTDLDALRAELAEDDRTINRIGSLPFNRYSYQSNYASDPIKPESIVGFRSPEIDYTWQIPYYKKPVQPIIYKKPATLSPTGTVRSMPVETVAPVLPKRETLLPISTDVVPMQTAGSYSEPTLTPDNLPRVPYKVSEPQASKLYPYSAAANLATMNKPVGYGKDTDGTEVEFSAKEWDKMKGTKYSEFNKPEKKKLGGWLNKYN